MKKTLMFNLLLMVCIGASAQFNFKTGYQQLVEKSVSEGVSLIVQEYTIQDTVSMRIFGRKGRPYFNRAYSLGVAAFSGTLSDAAVAHPWASDPDYKKYEGKQYRPVIGDATIYGKGWKRTICACESKSYADDALVYYPASGVEGFVIDSEFGEKDGWAVVVTVDEFSEKAKMEIDAMELKLTFSPDSLSYPGPRVPRGRKVLGGFYVNAVHLTPGVVSFSLAGIMVPDGANFKIIPLQAKAAALLSADDDISPIEPKKESEKTVENEQ